MLKLFISYSHDDESLINDFIKHISIFEEKEIFQIWLDKKNNPGEDFQKEIDKNLESSDIICLMISCSHLASNPCQEETKKAISLKKTKGVRIIPIILSDCAWLKNNELSKLLATPKDAKPVLNYENRNSAWLEVVTHIDNVCNSIQTIKDLKLKSEFKSFLNSVEILSKSHKNKDTIVFDDIFVYPKMSYYDDDEKIKKYESKNLDDEIIQFEKIIIIGEKQSGKTTLCKKLFTIFRNLNYIPIYIVDNQINSFHGNPREKLINAFKEQYESDNFDELNNNRIVPIIDDFQYAKYKDKYIESYKIYNNQILVVDEIFDLTNPKSSSNLLIYKKFKLQEFTPLERNELISKWIHINEKDEISCNSSYHQQSLDNKTELIDQSLGVIFGKGIMPSYPFFILTILATQDTVKPLDAEITSQGYCYQALIFLLLSKEKIGNDQIDTYINLLSELAFRIFNNNGKGLSRFEFDDFIVKYKSKYNFSKIVENSYKKVLSNVCISKYNYNNQYDFCYTYIYYFFVAKYLADNIDENKKKINQLLSNLHKDENAYISIFISHHSKSNYLLDELIINSEILFEKYDPATLNTGELSFFDNHKDKLIQAILPSFDNKEIQEERNKKLSEKSKIEERKNENNDDYFDSSSDEKANELLKNLRLSFKTAEVMGLIIKNRSGSLTIARLEYIFEQGLKLYLRVLYSFIELIKNDSLESEMVSYIVDRIKLKNKNNNKEISLDKLEEMVRIIYWNINFNIIYGFITKAIYSLGSSNLIKISQNVSNKQNTPAVFIVNQGIKMWYEKNIDLDEIVERFKEKDFSITATHILKTKIVEHCRLHKIEYSLRQSIENKLGFKPSYLLQNTLDN